MIMTVSFSTFDRLKSKGVAAYKKGEYLSAKTYLVDAAGCMIELAETARRYERDHFNVSRGRLGFAGTISRTVVKEGA